MCKECLVGNFDGCGNPLVDKWTLRTAEVQNTAPRCPETTDGDCDNHSTRTNAAAAEPPEGVIDRQRLPLSPVKVDTVPADDAAEVHREYINMMKQFSKSA